MFIMLLTNVHQPGGVVNYSLNATQKHAHRWLQQNSGYFSVLLTKHRRRSVDKRVVLCICWGICFRLYNGTELKFCWVYEQFVL